MESDFDWLAKPERNKIFKIIPYKRPSSSFGYSQAVKGTWKQYKKETNNPLAIRNRFKDSVDFIGWYTSCLLYTSPSPRDKRQSRMPSSA